MVSLCDHTMEMPKVIFLHDDLSPGLRDFSWIHHHHQEHTVKESHTPDLLHACCLMPLTAHCCPTHLLLLPMACCSTEEPSLWKSFLVLFALRNLLHLSSWKNNATSQLFDPSLVQPAWCMSLGSLESPALMGMEQ